MYQDIRETKTYENEYGKLIVEPITEEMPIKDFHSDMIHEDNRFDLETAEKIVLITENRRSQIGFPFPFNEKTKLYLVIHTSPSTVWGAKIVSLDYVGSNPQKSLEDELRKTPMTFFC